MTSSKQVIKTGVPQGSILGPLMFIIYINDLPLYVKQCNVDMYADDTTIHIKGNTMSNIENYLQEDLGNILKWCECNNMNINIQKTNSMLIGSKRKLAGKDMQIKICNMALTPSNCQKVLGIYIDKTLSWTEQVKKVSSKLSTSIALLRKMKKYLPKDARIVFYNSYILPILDYAAVVWGNGLTKQQVHQITKLQKKALKIMLDKPMLTESLSLFKEAKVLPFEQRIKYHTTVLVYKALHNMTPDYIRSLLETCQNSYNYNLRSTADNKLLLPKLKSETMRKSFSYSGVLSWNNLPLDLKNITSLAIFKQKLRNNFLSSIKL